MMQGLVKWEHIAALRDDLRADINLLKIEMFVLIVWNLFLTRAIRRRRRQPGESAKEGQP